MIELEQAEGRLAPLVVERLTTRFDAGVFALLGTRDNAVALLLAILAGREPVRAGRVLVLGAPAGAARTRPSIGYVPMDARWPDALRVDEALHVASELRGDSAKEGAARLAELGVASLAGRSGRTLSLEEARAVALAEALTSTVTRVVLIDEPFVSMDARAAPRVRDALRKKAEQGACVIVTTASPLEAQELADEALVFDRGRMVRRGPPADPVLIDGPRGALFRVVASDARALAAALASEDDVTRTETDGKMVLVRGGSRLRVASAIARAVKRANVDLHMLRAEAPPLDEMRAAAAGDLAGAYRVAFERAEKVAAAAGAPHEPPPAAPPSSSGETS